MTASKTLRVFIAESSPIITAGLQKVLDMQANICVVGTCADLDHARDHLLMAKPNLLILNPMLASYARRTAIRSLLDEDASRMPIVGLIYQYTEQVVLRQFDGLIEIDDTPQQIAHALQEATEQVARSVPDDTADSYELTDREREVLVLIAKGKMNKEIADELNISIHTVFSHRKNIIRKTGIKSVAGLTVYALLNNLIQQGEEE